MCHDTPKFLLARVFKQTRFKVKMEQVEGLLNKRRPGDVEVENQVSLNDKRKEITISVIAVFEPTGDCHSEVLRQDGLEAAATRYNARKQKYVILRVCSRPLFWSPKAGLELTRKIVRESWSKTEGKGMCFQHAEYYLPLRQLNLLTAIGFKLACEKELKDDTRQTIRERAAATSRDNENPLEMFRIDEKVD